MKYFVQGVLCSLFFGGQALSESPISPQQDMHNTSLEEPYVYLQPDIDNLAETLFAIKKLSLHTPFCKESLENLCSFIETGTTGVPFSVVKSGLENAAQCLAVAPEIPDTTLINYAETIENYYTTLLTHSDVSPEDSLNTEDIPTRSTFKNKVFIGNVNILGDHTVRGNNNVAGNTIIRGDTTLLNNLTVGGNVSIAGPIIVNGSPLTPELIANAVLNGGQSGPLTIGTTNATTLSLVTNGSNNERILIDQNGAVSVATPTLGTALSVTGNTNNPTLLATGNSTTTAPALRLIGDPTSSSSDFILTIDNLGNVRQSSGFATFGSLSFAGSNAVLNGGQPGPLTIGTTNATTLTLVTNGANNNRVFINQNGNVTISAPTQNIALSVAATGSNPAIFATGSGAGMPSLQLVDLPPATGTDFFLTVDTSGIIRQSAVGVSGSFGNAILNGGQAGPLTIGTSNASTLSFVTSGTTVERMLLDQNGSLTIFAPTVGANPTMSVNGSTSAVAEQITAGTGQSALNITGATGASTVKIAGTSGQNALSTTVGTVAIGVPTTGTALSVTGNTSNPAILATGNSTTSAPALRLFGDPASSSTDFLLTIDSLGNVRQSSGSATFGSLTFAASNAILNGGQPGPLTIGTTNATTLALVTGGANNERVLLDQNGSMTLFAPTAGTNPTVTVTGSTSAVAEQVTAGTGQSALNVTGATGASAVTIAGTSGQNALSTTVGTVTINAPITNTALSVTGNTANPAILATGSSTTTAPALRLVGDPASNSTDFLLTIDSLGNVRQSSGTATFGSLTFAASNAVVNGGQIGPVTIGTTNATPLSFITNNVNRLQIDQTGNATFSGNIKLPTATPNVSTSNSANLTNGLLELGGTNPSASNVSLYEIGTRNLFIGNYTVTPNVSLTTANDNLGMGINALQAITTGTGNIAIGPFANTALTTANNTIAIGSAASSSNTSSIAIGSMGGTIGSGPSASGQASLAMGSGFGSQGGPAASNTNAIAIGSAGTASGGIGPVASSGNAIAIGGGGSSGAGARASGSTAVAVGGGNGSFAGANATGSASVALGSADPFYAGPQALNNHSIAIGTGSVSSNAGTIAIGGPGSTNNPTALPGATASAASAIAIGGSSGNNQGASATGNNTISIGSSSSASGNQAIAIGSGIFGGLPSGAIASGLASIAIGSTDQGHESLGPTASGTRSIAMGCYAEGAANDTIALGGYALGSQPYAIGIGSNTFAGIPLGLGYNPTGTGAIAIGGNSTVGAQAIGTGSIAIGGTDGTTNASAQALSTDAIACGVNATAASTNSIALGLLATATNATNCIAVGTLSYAQSLGAIAIGESCQAIGLNQGGIAIGSLNGGPAPTQAGGTASVAIGSSDGTSAGATTTYTRNIAIGTGATASAYNQAIAIGSSGGTLSLTGASSSALGAIALGGSDGVSVGAQATSTRSIAIGTGSSATSNSQAIAIGSSAANGLPGATASGLCSIALGGSDGSTGTAGAYAGSLGTIAIGAGASATQLNSIALGYGASSTNVSSIAIGTDAISSNIGSIALGSFTYFGLLNPPIASGLASIALGSPTTMAAGPSASGQRSVAIGTGANTSQNDAIVLGDPSNALVAVGIGVNAPTAKLTVSGVGPSGISPLRLISLAANSSTTALVVDGSGNVYTNSGSVSSRRFKENFRNIDHHSEKIYSLNPVMFDYKKEYADHKNEFGLIAEEVEPYLPELVSYNENGEIHSVRYSSIIPLLLNETKKHQKTLELQGILINKLMDEIQQLKTQKDQ